jgi:hypothetical protein
VFPVLSCVQSNRELCLMALYQVEQPSVMAVLLKSTTDISCGTADCSGVLCGVNRPGLLRHRGGHLQPQRSAPSVMNVY